MANLLGQNIGTNYKGILNLDTINTPLDATLRAVTDGDGNASGLKLSTSDSSFSGKLGIGTDAPTFNLEVKQTSNQLRLSTPLDIYTYLEVNSSGGQVSMKFGNGSGTTHFINNYSTGVWASNKWAFGSSYFAPSAQLHVKGSGTTSATTALLVQNSAGNTSLQVTDEQQVTGFSGAQIRFRLGVTSGGQGISTRDGQCTFGFIDATQAAGLRFLAIGSGSSFIDGWTEGSSKATNYPLFIGSRVNNSGIGVSGITTAENGTQTFFGSAVSYPSAIVGINSTTRGFLPPRMTTTQKNAIAAPASGLVVYDNVLDRQSVYTTAWQNSINESSVSPNPVADIWSGTQAEYDALTPIATTLYFIV